MSYNSNVLLNYIVSVSHDIFQFFIYATKKKRKMKIAPANFLGIPLFFEAQRFGEILATHKDIEAH